MNVLKRKARSRVWSGPVVLILPALMLAACDFEVVNPGPYQDRDLDEATAHPSVVAGMARSLARIVNWGSFKSAAIAQEVTPAGIGLTYGYSAREIDGILISDGQSTRWNEAQRARWVAETGVERFRETLGADFANSPNAAWGLVYAGYANRLLGELYCWTVIDGGSPQPSTHSLERAHDHFTEALSVAQSSGDTDALHAAHAGRASIRMWLGDWAGAVADAQSVPTDFEFVVEHDPESAGWHNLMYYASANTPYRVHSLWNTFYEDYYLESDDPRVAWVADPDVPNMQPGAAGALNPWFFQQKFEGTTAPTNLTSGREMRLIEAEALLVQGDWPGAMATVNALRADVGVEPWEVNGVEDAWTALKRERGIELWGEGRRLGDLRRWIENETPGDQEDMTGRSLCFPIGQSEIDTNPNVTEEYATT